MLLIQPSQLEVIRIKPQAMGAPKLAPSPPEHNGCVFVFEELLRRGVLGCVQKKKNTREQNVDLEVSRK
jgi:hypothetical protein